MRNLLTKCRNAISFLVAIAQRGAKAHHMSYDKGVCLPVRRKGALFCLHPASGMGTTAGTCEFHRDGEDDP